VRWIIRIFVTLITLVVVAVAALFLVPTDRIARIAEAQFEQNTGRALSIAGEVRPQIFPRLGVSLEDVAISNAEWSGKGPLMQAASLEMGVGMAALLGGEIVVEAFDIQSPVIRLERNRDGVGNWEFLTDLGGGDDAVGGTPKRGGGRGLGAIQGPSGEGRGDHQRRAAIVGRGRAGDGPCGLCRGEPRHV